MSNISSILQKKFKFREYRRLFVKDRIIFVSESSSIELFLISFRTQNKVWFEFSIINFF